MNIFKIVTIIGTRPQFIKAAVVSRAISEQNKIVDCKSLIINEVIVHTDQHYDYNMSDVFFEGMHLPKPNYHLGINGLLHGAMTGRMLEKIEKLLIAERPDAVLLYGDTNTTLAGALAAVKLHLPVIHVEAGLRSFNRIMPEEHNRVLTDHVSTLLFCPTQRAVENLNHEGISNDPFSHTANSNGNVISRIHLVGDVMFDAAIYYRQYKEKPKLKFPKPFILATLHREENINDSCRLKSIFDAFDKIGKEIPIIFPLHPRTRKILDENKIQISKSQILIIEPVSYLEMIYFLENCALVMTDSGGLQKEAFFFKKPCIILRKETEWEELVQNGVSVIAGADNNILEVVELMSKKNIDYNLNLYGNGDAGKKIVNILTNTFNFLHQ